MARCRRCRRHRRRAEFGRRSLHQFAAAGFADDVSGVVDRELRSHRQGLFAEYDPVGQRRLGDRQHDGGGDDGARRQGLVLRHGRLRARQGHRGRGHQLHREARRQGAGFEQASARHLGFRLVPAAGAEFQGQGDRACQCRRRHHQRGQAGQRVRYPAERPDHGGVPAVRQRRPRHGVEGRARACSCSKPSIGTWTTTPARSQNASRRGRA